MQRRTLTTLVSAGTLAAGAVTYQLVFAPVPANVGPLLTARGYTMAVTIPHEDPFARRLTPLTVSAQLAQPFSAEYAASFQARYGVALDQVKGYTVSHRWADGLVEGVMNDPTNPLGLECNPQCYLTPQDRQDIEMAARPGDRVSIYDTLFVDLDRRLHPPPEPPPAPTPPPTSPPATAGKLEAREIPCPSTGDRSTGQLCLEIVEVPRVP